MEILNSFVKKSDGLEKAGVFSYAAVSIFESFNLDVNEI